MYAMTEVFCKSPYQISKLKEKAGDSSSKGPAHLSARPNAPPYTLPVLPMDDDEVSYKGKIIFFKLGIILVFFFYQYSPF
jgi:hypothetical protein